MIKSSIITTACAFLALAVSAQNLAIPDANFKTCLVANTFLNTNGDGEIQVSEASIFAGIINCNNRNIANATGIAAFPLLDELYLDFNQLMTLDVSANTLLQHLHCTNNHLTNLDVTANDTLRHLHCDSNPIASLDVSTNQALVKLQCSYTPIQSLDISGNPILSFLECKSNQLSSLNIKNGNNINFTYHNFSDNPALTCIQVDDVAYANAHFTSKDAMASYNTECVVGVENITTKSLRIYPNPAVSVLYLETSENITTKIITDIQGRVVMTDNSNNNNLLVSDLPAGVYFLHITTEKGIYQEKFVKE